MDEKNPYRKKWMTAYQWECAKMFADIVGGFHHVSGGFKPHGEGVSVSDHAGARWATFDSDRLTRAVVLAHDRMIRLELCQSGPRRVGFILWKRKSRDGSMSVRHPTIEDAIKMHRRASSEAA